MANHYLSNFYFRSHGDKTHTFIHRFFSKKALNAIEYTIFLLANEECIFIL